MLFNGWGAHWDNDTTSDVMKFEPQLRRLAPNAFPQKHLLHGVMVGAEIEFSHHYLFQELEGY